MTSWDWWVVAAYLGSTSRRETRLLQSCAATIFFILVLADRALAPAAVP